MNIGTISDWDVYSEVATQWWFYYQTNPTNYSLSSLSELMKNIQKEKTRFKKTIPNSPLDFRYPLGLRALYFAKIKNKIQTILIENPQNTDDLLLCMSSLQGKSSLMEEDLFDQVSDAYVHFLHHMNTIKWYEEWEDWEIAVDRALEKGEIQKLPRNLDDAIRSEILLEKIDYAFASYAITSWLQKVPL